MSLRAAFNAFGSGKWEVGSGKWEVGSGKWEDALRSVLCHGADVFEMRANIPERGRLKHRGSVAR